jgi:hypothetical protein
VLDELTAKARARLNLFNLSAAYKKCFCDPETGQLTKAGERVLRDLGAFSGLNGSPLRVSPVSRQVDTHATCTAIGRAESIKRIWSFIKLDPSTHQLMKDDPHE